MADPIEERSSAAREAAMLALVRVCYHYGGRPEFVLLGGLVPGLLCSEAPVDHAGTTDVDVQVDLEIAGGSTNALRLEQALRNADFEPDAEREWRWKMTPPDGPVTVIKFELLADLDSAPQNTVVSFNGSEALGAANLRGTGYAAADVVVTNLSANDHGTWLNVEVQTTGLAGFLFAKASAAYGRHAPKDYYDIAYVLLHHDDPSLDAATVVLQKLGMPQSMRSPIQDLAAQFEDPTCPGALAYALQATELDPDPDADAAAMDAVLAVTHFTQTLLAA